MIHEVIELEIPGVKERASLHTYLWSNSKELYDGLTRPLILLCPGGAYALTSDREAEGLAVKFMSMGFHAAVLRYSVAPAVFPTALLQLAKAVELFRSRAEEWYIDPDKIIVQGSSAGGHLAASLGVFWNSSFLQELMGTKPEGRKPNGLMLSYPVITSGEYANRISFCNLLGNNYDKLVGKMSLENQAGPHTPPTFLWHTFEDESVPVENSLLWIQALRNYGIPAEFHLFPEGVHGLGSAGKLTVSKDGRGIQKECQMWMQLAENWVNATFCKD